MMKKRIDAVYAPQLDNMDLSAVASAMEGVAARDYVAQVNWPDKFPYKPIVAVDTARGDKELYIHFFVRGNYLLAANTEFNSPVYHDSCVEFFAHIPGQKEYYNFEFNCIGTALASKRLRRTDNDYYPDEMMMKIRTWSSLGKKPFAEKTGIFSWELVVAVPFELFGLDSAALPEKIDVNFYKCGDNTSLPHYLSWNRIETPEPDFHRVDFFGEMYF